MEYTLEYTLEDLIITEKEGTSTERVRRYYKRHPDKVRKYLKKTVKDRVARNRDRRKAIQKHGHSKVKNHDVHHPDGPNGGKWELAPKDHGRDTKDMKKVRVLRKKDKSVAPIKPTGGKEPTVSKEPTKPVKNIKFKAHNFKNLDLTFDEMTGVLSRSLGEILGMGTNITDSLHSETLKITVSEGKLLIISNKSDVADAAKTGVTSGAFVNQYEGNVKLKTAITQVLVDLEKMLRTEKNTEVIAQIFNDGKKFLTIDIFTKKTESEVQLNKNFVVFKNVVSYNEDYKEDAFTQNGSKLLAANMHKFQYASDPQSIKNVFFSEESINDIEKRVNKISVGFKNLTVEYSLTMESTIRDYMIQVCDLLLTDLAKEETLEFTGDEFNSILYRWVDNEEFDLSTMEDNKRQAIREYELSDLRDDISEEMSQYQKLILSGGVLMIQRINNTLVVNLPHKKKIINNEAVRAVDNLNEAYKDDKDVYEELQKQLRRLQSIEIEIGNVGFYYNDELYLFTDKAPFVASNRDAAAIEKGQNSSAGGDSKQKKTSKVRGANPLTGILTKLFQQKTKVVNPSTGEFILLRTALGYGAGHPAYDTAREWLKNNIKGLPAFRDPQVAIFRKKTNTSTR
jgi:hypothetical protein